MNENTGAYTMGRLFNEIGATLTEQNVNDITQALIEKGMDRSTARKNAKALALVVEGGDLSDLQVAAIEFNDALAEAVKTTIIDPNATWFQRSQGYNEALMAIAQEKVSKNVSETDPAQQSKDNGPTVDNVVASENENGLEDISEADVDTADITDAPAETASQVHYEAPADGQTIRKSTGETVSLQKISSIKDGKLTFQTEDGAEVDAEDVSYASEDEAQVYKAIAALGETIDTDTANKLSAHLLKLGEASSASYVRGIVQAYQYGYYGYSRNSMVGKHTQSALLTEAQRNVAYGYGEKMREANSSSATPASQKGKRQRGRVMSWGIPLQQMKQSFNPTQKQAFEIIRTIAEVTGIDVVLYRSKADADGNFRGGIVNGIDMSDSQGAFSWHNSKIYIDVNAGLTHKSQMNDLAMYSMLRTFSHEFVHFIEKHNPVEYENFRDLVFEVMKEKGSDPDEMIDVYMMQHRNSTRDEASREVVAEAMTDILPESQFVERLAQKHQGIFKKLLEQLKAFIKEIKDHFAHIGDTSAPEVAALREQIDGAVRYTEKIVEAFDRVAVEAVERYHEGAPAQKNTAEGGVQSMARKQVNFEQDKYFESQVNKWESLSHGAYVKVGVIGNNSPIAAVGMPAGQLRYDVSKLKKICRTTVITSRKNCYSQFQRSSLIP